MAEFEDPRLRTAMRAYLDACDALESGDSAEGDGPREFIERADAKTLTEMVLRQQLIRLGWTAPREHAPAADKE